jgi:hypothetical protein
MEEDLPDLGPAGPAAAQGPYPKLIAQAFYLNMF